MSVRQMKNNFDVNDAKDTIYKRIEALEIIVENICGTMSKLTQ